MKEILAPSIAALGEEKVFGAIGSSVAHASQFLGVEMRFNEDKQAIQCRRPDGRSANIKNTLDRLEPDEKLRLAHIIMWSLDGPEQGFIDNKGVWEYQIELDDFLKANGITMGSRMVEYARYSLAELAKNPEPTTPK